MRTEIIPFEDLNVIQTWLNEPSEKYLRDNFDIDKWDVPKGFEYEGKVYVGDGTHRAHDLLERGYDSTPISILETDEDVAKYNKGMFIGLKTMKEVHDFYKRRSEPNTTKAGIESVVDLKDKGERLFDIALVMRGAYQELVNKYK